MATGMQGFEALGGALAQAFGGGGSTEVYDEAMSRGHRLQKQLAEARIKTDEMNQRENLDIALSNLYREQPELAQAFSTMLRANVGGNFQQLTAGGINLTRGQALDGARSAAMAGDLDAANAMLAVHQGRPIERTKVSGNTLYDPYAAPGAQQAQITPYGEGYLANQMAGIEGRTEVARLRASTPSANGDRRETADDAAVKAVAEDIYRTTRLDTPDAARGVTAADIRYALANRGEWTNPNNGQKYTFSGPKFAGVTSSVDSTAGRATAPVAVPSDAMRGSLAPAAGGMPAPKTQAEYAALPSGTQYVAPDGSTRIKP